MLTIVNYQVTKLSMIESFRHKALKSLYDNDDSRKLPPEMVGRIRSILTALDAARSIEALDARRSGCIP